MSKYNIYCDMDGVLVDFDKGYLELTGHKLDGEHRSDDHFWDPINEAGYDLLDENHASKNLFDLPKV